MESKTYVFGENGNNGMMSLLAPLMQKSGLDPNLLLAMNRNNGGFGGEGGWFMWVIFLFFLMGWGGICLSPLSLRRQGTLLCRILLAQREQNLLSCHRLILRCH